MRDSANWHRFEVLRRDPEKPLYVRNNTDQIIDWRLFDGDDFVVNKHPNRGDLNLFVIWPTEVLNLREVMTEQPLHSSMTLHWQIETKKLVVLNEACWDFDDPDLAALQQLSEMSPPRYSHRYYAIKARRDEIECTA